MKNSKLVNGKNYYNKESLNEMCSELERGETIRVYIDCIGHTRNNDEQEAYKEALQAKYSDALKVTLNEGAYSYSYSYRLER